MTRTDRQTNAIADNVLLYDLRILFSCAYNLQKLLREYTFLIFCFLMIIFTLFVYRKVPETKNRTFEEIASQFQPGGDIDVEEIVHEDEEEDMFGMAMISAVDVAKMAAGDVRDSIGVPPKPHSPPKLPVAQTPKKNADADDEQFWVIRL